MLRREALPLFGRHLADVLGTPGGDALITLWSSAATVSAGGEELEVGWDRFFDVLRTRRPFRGRLLHPGWTGATFAPATRTVANVRSVAALVFVFGREAGVSLDTFVSGWGNRFGMLFTTAEHSPGHPSFVAVLPYARTVSLAEHQRTTDVLAATARRKRIPFEPGARNPARYVYLPGAIPGRAFEARSIAGMPIHPAGGEDHAT